MIAIKHRFSGATICEFDVITTKECAVKGKENLSGAYLSRADLSGADMSGADMSGANLTGANLYGANLFGANLSGAEIDGEKITKNPISISGLRYACLITENYMRLGCKRYTHYEWSEFNNQEISDMDSYALEFWNQWKILLLTMCKQHAEQ